MKTGRVEISPGFLLLGAWLNYMDEQGIFWHTIIGCGIHELCHLLVLRLMGIPVQRVRITIVGAEICVGGGMSYGGEMAAALAGPTGNLLLAWLASRMFGGEVFAGVNLILGLFNLLPVGRLDGGRVLNCAAACLLGPDFGELVSEGVSGLCLMGLCLAGGWSFYRFGNLTLLLISVWMVYSLKDIGAYRQKRTK